MKMKSNKSLAINLLLYFLTFILSPHQVRSIGLKNWRIYNLENLPNRKNVCNIENNEEREFIYVHLIAHSHDDVGWLKTVEQYFSGLNNTIQQAHVSATISSVVSALDPHIIELWGHRDDRKFSFIEMAFLWRWYKQQNSNVQQLFKDSVNNGAIEIVSGGWVMHDEATTHYIDMIDQMTLGHWFINSNFNITPTSGWQIDPFGHSLFNAWLSQQLGLDGITVARIDFQDFHSRVVEKSLDMLWKLPPPCLTAFCKNSSKILFSVLSHHYVYPQKFCVDTLCSDDNFQEDPQLDDFNVDSRVNQFIHIVNSQYVKTRKFTHFIVPMGSDFTYQSADLNFRFLDSLINHVNQKACDTNIFVFYSTPSLYYSSLLAHPDQKQLLPEKNEYDDFFPYADQPGSYWVGYYATRPNLKKMVRGASNLKNAFEKMVSICWLKEFEQVSEYPITRSGLKEVFAPQILIHDGQVHDALFNIRQTLGELQHHDAVSGTSKLHVVLDYSKRLSQAEQKVHQVISSILFQELHEKINNDRLSQITFEPCPLLNISICPPIEEAALFSEKKKNTVSIVLGVFNPLGWKHTYILPLPLRVTNLPNFNLFQLKQTSPPDPKLLRAEWEQLPQTSLSLYSNPTRSSSSTINYFIEIELNLRPLQLEFFRLDLLSSKSSCPSPSPLLEPKELSLSSFFFQSLSFYFSLFRVRRYLSTVVPRSPNSDWHLMKPSDGEAKIKNEYMQLGFTSRGISWLESFSSTNARSPVRIDLSHSFEWYKSYQLAGQTSGYYVFRPHKIPQSSLNPQFADIGTRYSIPVLDVLHKRMANQGRHKKLDIQDILNNDVGSDVEDQIDSSNNNGILSSVVNDTFYGSYATNIQNNLAINNTSSIQSGVPISVVSSTTLCESVMFIHSRTDHSEAYSISVDPIESPCYLKLSLCKGQKHLQMEWSVGPLDISDGVGKEVILKLATDIRTDGAFETDSNGYFMLLRKRNERPSYNHSQIVGLEYEAANYYPVVSTFSIYDNSPNTSLAKSEREESRRKLTLMVDRPVGATSLSNGEMEIMLHRLTLRDDNKGVEEPFEDVVPEYQQDGKGIRVRGKFYLHLGSHANIREEKENSDKLVKKYATTNYGGYDDDGSVNDDVIRHRLEASLYNEPIVQFAVVNTSLFSHNNYKIEKQNPQSVIMRQLLASLLELPGAIQFITLSPLPFVPVENLTKSLWQYGLVYDGVKSQTMQNSTIDLLLRLRNLNPFKYVPLDLGHLFSNFRLKLITISSVNISGLKENKYKEFNGGHIVENRYHQIDKNTVLLCTLYGGGRKV